MKSHRYVTGEADGFLYFVMPYIDGETLRDNLDRETQLGIDEAVKIAMEVADALDYAHNQSVIREAFAWLQTAASQGNHDAIRNRRRLLRC